MNNWLAIMMAASVAGVASAGTAEPSFQEVREVLRTNLDGVTEADLEQAAVHGLVHQFDGRVLLLTNGAPKLAEDSDKLPLMLKTAVFEEVFGYLRVGRIAEGSAAELAQKHEALGASNKLNGLVLDLRFAAGRDFKLAAAVADLFIESEVALMEWKGETIKAKAKAQAIPGPLVVLVNRATRGAAEVLAAILREQRTAILIGGPTAGQAVEMTEFKLKTGQTLLVATAAVKLGGGNRLSAGGIQPDISVQVAQDEELAYWENPYKQFGSGINLAASTATAATNRLAKPRLNEAELVRLKRQGLDPETELDARPTWLAEPPRQLVNDPALARGLDLLKGLSLLKSSRPL